MAYVLSSISGNLISAASAGFAPTNGADVSAIASAYQVVSATATQLNAGTAYVTSINETPISAARAGNAANAALATSAWYDGTGRILSALPDEATVSSIASAYAESAASSKQDTLTFAWNADSAISSINGSALAVQGGGSPIVVTGTAWDPDTSAYVYDLSSNLSAAQRHVYSSQLDGRYSYIDKFLDDSANTYRLEASLIRAGAEQYASGWSSKFVYMPGVSMWSTADAATGVFSPLRYATGACLAMDVKPNFKAYYKGNEWFVADIRYGMLRGEIHQSRGLRIVASGANSASGFQIHPSGVDGVDKNGSAWKYGPSENNNLSSVYDTVSANSASWGQGGVDSATVSAIASSYAESAMSSKLDESATADFYSTSNPSGFITGVDLSDYATTTYVDSSVSSKLDSTAYNSAEFYSTSNPSGFITGVDLSNYATTAYVDSSVSSFVDSGYVESQVSSKQDTLSFSYDDDKISAINGSALAGQGGVDIATVSSIASSYAKSAASSKLDTTSQVVTATGSGTWDYEDCISSVNGAPLYAKYAGLAYYDSALRNISQLPDTDAVSSIASSYAESAVSSKADSSALSSYALSADVSGTVDLVSTQSANWGGSALALSAGPGVKLEKVGDTLVAGLEGPVYGEETLAGYHNGQVVYQTLVSGVFSSHEGKTAISSNALYSSSPLAWFDVSQSYIIYGNTGNILPLSWQLGTGRNGSISLLGGARQCVYRGQDSSPTQCSAFITVKYVKA